jgi:predicted dehydrogenase
MSEAIRIGIVGAGANTRLRHIPGFQAIDGVELRGVVNRSRESTTRAASEFGIPQPFGNWQELVASSDIDAVMIGTWPNMHCEITCAALVAGKHVLTEARMARSLDEARRMQAVARQYPDVVTQIVPSPLGLEHDSAVRRLIADGYLGELREVVVLGASPTFHDDTAPLHWRQDREISGVNTLALGILHEALIRWCPDPTRVFAQSGICKPHRPAGIDGRTQATVADSLQILTEIPTASGTARGMYHLSGVTLFGPGNQIHLYGSAGTLKATFGAAEEILIGQAGDSKLQRLEVPEQERGGWRVEEEFIAAIRGTEPIRFTDFATGVRYMEFTESVSLSVSANAPIELPLETATSS